MLNAELFAIIIWVSILNAITGTTAVLLLAAAAASRRVHLARVIKKPDQT